MSEDEGSDSPSGNLDEKVDTSTEKDQGQGSTSASSVSRLGNPLYCSYIDGVYTYKDPRTENEFWWDEAHQQWNPQRVFGQEVKFDGDTYTYVDPGDGTTVYEWDPLKTAWFPKTEEADLSKKENVEDGIKVSPTTTTIGFHNPNYDSSLQLQSQASASNQPRRFYYAALSPTEMGVNEPVLFLSPDDQVNNNSTISGDEEEPPIQSSVQFQQPEAPSNCTIAKVAVTLDLLPPGWERHEDGNGSYFWHIKSGTIQREPPSISKSNDLLSGSTNNPALLIPGSLSSNSFRRSQTISCQLSSSASSMTLSGSGSGFGLSASNYATDKPIVHLTEMIMDKSEKRKSWSQYLENSEREKEQERIREALLGSREKSYAEASLRFVAVSLGCLSISEEDLTPERSSRAVSKVIAELTNPGVKGLSSPGLEVAGKIWGGGSELFLELDTSHLRVKAKERSLIVAEQPIHSIRVWGVGRDDPRDFAYVAREKVTRQFLCHVFRLEMNARPLASALRDACKKIMMERQRKQKRPTTLPTGLRKTIHSSSHQGHGTTSNTTATVSVGLFPTPMDEPRKVIKAYYLGSKMVAKPTGMNTLNSALDALKRNAPIAVNVSVAPSVLLITSEELENPKVAIEIRVRYLSFMGIGHDVQTCGVIVHTARDDFQAHGFYSTPSSGALCKAIEAACVLRYQKCLDAHHIHNTHNNLGGTGGNNSAQGQSGNGTNSGTGNNSEGPSISSTPSKAANLATAFKNVLASFSRAKSVES